MTAPNVPGLRELGIAGTDEELLEASRADPVIAAEAVARVRAPRRQRPGPLEGEERAKIVTETIAQLKRDLYVLLVATDGLGDVCAALAQAGLDLRRYPPAPDALAETLRKKL